MEKFILICRLIDGRISASEFVDTTNGEQYIQEFTSKEQVEKLIGSYDLGDDEGKNQVIDWQIVKLEI